MHHVKGFQVDFAAVPFIHKRGSSRFLANSMNKEQFSLSRSFTHLLSVDSNYPLLHAVRFVSLTVQMGAFFCIGVKLSDYLSTVYRLEFWLSVKMLNQALTSAFIFRLPQREWLVVWLLSSFSRKVHALILILVWKGKCNKPCLPFKVNFYYLAYMYYSVSVI